MWDFKNQKPLQNRYKIKSLISVCYNRRKNYRYKTVTK